jgi:iron complex outermembrane receptor protein
MFQRTKLCTSLLVAFSGSLFAVAPAFAQDASGQTVQRVEITGSSIKRIEAETDAPVQTLTREDIARSGATSVEQLLQTISASTSSGATVAASASGATTGGISAISLRGLGPDRTLILVNGQRSAPYGSPASSVAVDVDSIPIAAIERVEVLKEGASAVYGSDAIAGVINFILRKNYSGNELDMYAGTSYDHKGSQFRLSLLSGHEFEKGNITFLATASHDSPLYGADRPFARTAIRPDRDNFAGSSRTDPGNISIPGIGVRNPNVQLDASGNPTGVANCGPNSVYSPDFGPAICLFDTGPYVNLTPDTHRAAVMVSGHYDVNDSFRLKSDLSFTYKSQEVAIQPSPIDTAFGIPFLLTTANPYYPKTFVEALTGGTDPTLSVRYRPFITGLRDLVDNAENFRAVVGAEGTMGGWDYDANLLYTTSEVTENLVSGYFRINGGSASGGPGIESLLNGDVKDANGNTLWVNPFGQNSDAVVAAAHATNYVGTAFRTNTSLESAQFKMSKEDLAKLSSGNLGAAFGLEIRKEGYQLKSSAALASGDISGYGGNFFPIDKDRSVMGVFGELDAPVFKGFDVDAALRYDRYSATDNPGSVAAASAVLEGFQAVDADGNGIPAPDGYLPPDVVNRVATESTTNAPSFGKTTGKIGAKWNISKEYLLRSTLSTGFRAPSLLDLYGPLQSGVSAILNDPARCNTTNSPSDCVTQFNIYTGGNGNLKPEHSTTWTFGGVAEPVRNVSFAADFFHIKLEDAITVLPVDYLLSHESLYTDRITRAPTDIPGLPGPIIAIDQRTENVTSQLLEGLDWDLHTGYDASSGHYGFDISGTWNTKNETVNPDGSTTNNIGVSSAATPGIIPRVRAQAIFSYRLPSKVLETSVTYNWQSGFTDICGSLDQDDFGNCAPGIEPPKVRPYATTDFQMKWDPTKSFTGTFGVKNVFGNQPPYTIGTGSAFQAGYDPTYVDPHGRFFYVAGSVRF